MEASRRRGYAWAISAGFNAALAAVSAKFVHHQVMRYGLVVLLNVTMWGCYVNSLKALSSLQATVTNFATNFLTSGFTAFFLFQEPLHVKVIGIKVLMMMTYLLGNATFYVLLTNGAMLIVIGVLVLSKSSIEKKERSD